MKRLYLSLLFLVGCVCSYSQKFNEFTSLSRVAIVYYEQDNNGFYHKKENVNLKEVSDFVSFYGYNKKSQELYCTTKNANCVVTLNDALAKTYKKSSVIPQIKDKEVTFLISEQNKYLEDKFNRLNELRQKFIEDSIAKVKADSLKKVREDSLAREESKRKIENYKKNHRWCWVPTLKNSMYCVLCEKNVDTKDSTLCYTIKNDSIYWGEFKRGTFDIGRIEIHVAKLSDYLKKEPRFVYHCSAFKDSLENRIDMDITYAAVENYDNYKEYLETIRKTAPHGFFDSWGWDNEYSSISFNFRYTNTNKKTIKYIEVFWTCTNDVGDVRKTGSFRGTGPLEEWQSASWEWEHSNYYVAGDASKMRLTKVLITYMDGTKVTIPKNKIMYE